MAHVAKLRSEDPYIQVGAIALDYENRVLAAGYNGLPPGKIVDPSFWADRDKRLPFVVHAEMNLMALFKRGECRTLAITLLPCGACANNIVAHKIKRVVYSEDYHRDQISKEIFKFAGVELIQLNYGNDLCQET